MLERFWHVSWRTARLCAHETFFDCPHYEQMQFPGDTRVQAIFHYLIADEDRLARKAIDDFHASRVPEGLTLCKYPSQRAQILPTYSLYWIGMLHDFRVYRGDLEFLRRYLPGAREVMAWFERRLRPDGMLGRLDYAPFVDWARDFQCGNAPQDPDGGSAILTLLLAQACQWMAGLESACGFPQLTGRWSRMGRDLVKATLRVCWDARRALLADTAQRRSFSLHAQVEGILAGAWPQAKARAILCKALDDEAITQPGTFYYRYYVAQALKRVGERRRFFDLLSPWEKCLPARASARGPKAQATRRAAIATPGR